jgi:hypothetical protein
MTLGEAVELLRPPFAACACPGEPYCCRPFFAQATALQRGAHIAVKQLAELVQRADEHTEVCR